MGALADDLGPGAPTITHENGSRESLSPFALEVVPRALAWMLSCMRRDNIIKLHADAHTSNALDAVLIYLMAARPGHWSLADGCLHALGAIDSVLQPGLESKNLPAALLEVGRVLWAGEQKYGSDQNWRGIPVRQHLRHAITHLVAHLAGDRSEGEIGHLTRGCCRLMFVIEMLPEEAP